MKLFKSYELRVKRIAFLLFCSSAFLPLSTVFCQLSTREKPVSFLRNIPPLTLNEHTQKIMPFLDMVKIEKEDEDDNINGIPPRFGFPQDVDYDLDNSGEWIELENGDKIWRLNIICPNAKSVSLVYDAFWIPDGAKLFIYRDDLKQHIGAFTSRNNIGDVTQPRGFATGFVYGSSIIIEYYVPNELQEVGVISITKVVHGYRYFFDRDNYRDGYGSSGPCQVNINCPEGGNWQNEKNAVALIASIGDARLCTGALINTTGEPYFLTADHCLNWGTDAITNPNIDTWVFYWHYESPECISAYDPPFISTARAVVVANKYETDFALLKLVEDPLDNFEITPYYLGWDRSDIAIEGGVGIYHPAGDIKKIATYITIMDSTNCVYPPGSYWTIVFKKTESGHSVTEGGSSGSPLINAERRVIGQLYGGGYHCGSTCRTNNAGGNSSYGKFSVSWTGNGAAEIERRLDYWLDPLNTGALTMDGSHGCRKNLTEHTITTDINIVGCDNLLIQDITISNDATVYISAGEMIWLMPGFHAEAGTNVSLSISTGKNATPQLQNGIKIVQSLMMLLHIIMQRILLMIILMI